jgi:hypothetical protein
MLVSDWSEIRRFREARAEVDNAGGALEALQEMLGTHEIPGSAQITLWPSLDKFSEDTGTQELVVRWEYTEPLTGLINDEIG